MPPRVMVTDDPLSSENKAYKLSTAPDLNFQTLQARSAKSINNLLQQDKSWQFESCCFILIKLAL